MAFQNSVVGGVTLVRPAIQSPDYVSGSSGWAVMLDGSAEFNDVVIRGGTSVSGTSLYYSGTPTAGNLIVSIAAAAGTDEFGNAYPQGVGLEGGSGKVTIYDATGTAVITLDGTNGLKAMRATGGQYVQIKPQAILSLGHGSWTTEGDLHVDSGGLTLQSPYGPVGLSGDQVRLFMHPGASNGIAPGSVSVSSASGNPATLSVAGNLHAGGSGTEFQVDSTGTATTYANNTWQTYTPVMTGAGSATWSSVTGYWRRLGDWIDMRAYFVFSGAGSGTTPVSVTAPTSIDRTTRQFVMCQLEQVVAGSAGWGAVVAFQSGSGNVFDRVRNPGNSNLTGADFTATSLVTVQGWYRQG
jgi:hypothetical protein